MLDILVAEFGAVDNDNDTGQLLVIDGDTTNLFSSAK